MGRLDSSWRLEKGGGDLSAATAEQPEAAAHANPNDPASAQRIAQDAIERRRACPPGGSRRGEQSAHGGRGEQDTPHMIACTPGYLELPAEVRAAAECEFFTRTGEQADSARLCGSERGWLIVLLGGRVYAQANAEEPGSYTLMLADEH